MKNSGIEWIGEIPDSWMVGKLKNHLISYKSGGTPDSSNEEYYTDIGTPWVVIADMTANDYIKDTTKHITDKAIKDKGLEILPKGTILYAMYASVGKVAELAVNATVNQAILGLNFDDEVERQYIKYFLSSWESYIKSESNGTTQFNLNAYKVVNLASIYPSIKEQQRIAQRLDEKCGKIDELIANQEKQIEKLKEYKQSVITEAVTKGLDKSAPMKDSGIEWIGEIPENYIICKIKHILDNSDFGIKCGPFGSALTGKVVDNGSVLIYGQWNVVDGNFNKKRNTITGKDFDDLSAYEVLPGDILVSMMGTIGKCAIVPTDISRGIMDSHIIKIRLNNNVVLHKFFEYQYDKDNSFIVYEYFKRVKKGFIMDGLNTRLIKNAFFILPSLYEQQQIVDYLDEKCGKIDRLIAIKQEKIEKLQEYKKSLIYEYVTGKKEVV